VATSLISNPGYEKLKIWSFSKAGKGKLLFAFFFDGEDAFGAKQRIILQQVDPNTGYSVDLS
jgi:hypothetical protein